MTTDALIVAMRPAHITLLMRHEAEMFGPEAWSADSYREELADRRHRLYLAAVEPAGAGGVEGDLLGWGGVRVLADEAEILTVGVVPTARRRGIATALLAGLLDGARQRGASEVYLEVRVDNPGARALYLREGFTDLGLRRGYYEHGRVDAVTMGRTL